MVNQSVLVVVAILLATSCTLTSGNKKDIITPGHVIPFQPISSAEYRAILDLSNGNPVISEARLISSGLSAIHSIANSIKNGAITALNLTGIESAASSLLRPSGDKVQGYPLCVIRTNKRSARGARKLDSIFQSNDDGDSSDGGSGSYTISLYKPGDDDNDDDYDDEDNYHHHSSTSRPTRRPRPSRPNRPNWPGNNGDDDNDSNDNSTPVVNCVVVLKRPSSSISTSTRRPTRRPTRPTRYTTENPSNYQPHYPPQYPPQYPGHYPPPYPHHPYPTPSSSSSSTSTTSTTTPKPHHPHQPQYPYYPYPIIPVPIPQYHGGYPSYPSYPSYPGYPSYGHGWNNWHYRPRPTPSTTSTTTAAPGTVTSSTLHPPHSWPVYPGHGGSLPGHWRSPLESEAVRHHYLGNGAKDIAYDGASFEASEDDAIESEVSDIIEAIAKAKSARVFKNKLKVLPLAEDSEEGK